MSITASQPVRNDGLSHTTLGIAAGLSPSSIAAVVRALQRVPGVLTVDADAERAHAFVAHDAGVPIAALVTAANQAGAAAKRVVAPRAGAVVAETESAQQRTQRRMVTASIGLTVMSAVVLIDIALLDNPGKRWSYFASAIILCTFILLQSTTARRKN